jgi:hypothetical protein
VRVVDLGGERTGIEVHEGAARGVFADRRTSARQVRQRTSSSTAHPRSSSSRSTKS